MFDGVVDIGVDYVNGKGKQRSVSNFFNALDQLWTTWMHRWININLIFWEISLKRKKVDTRIGNRIGILKKK